MKKTVFSFAILIASFASNPALAQSVSKSSSSRASTFAQRFEQFAKKASNMTDVSDSVRAKNDSIYRAYLEEYSVVKDSLSDEDVRRVSKAKVLYQKGKVRNFTDKTSEQVVDAADSFSSKVSKVFKKTKKKVQGAIDALKD